MNHIANTVRSTRTKQAGQGMTEYIIIVALIAVAAISVYGFFGDAIRAQMGAMTNSVAGNNTAATAAQAKATAAGASGAAAAAKKGDLATYSTPK